MKFFPSRVWEPTGVDDKGRTLWSSREATPDDHKRRRQWLKQMIESREEEHASED